jgi:nicotinamide-nucleotide amidase
MQAIILSIGDELASGMTVNTNSSWLAQQLLGVGVETIAHMTVGDDLQRVAAAIREACDHVELDAGKPGGGIVLVTGGLGPTQDDVTRQALADALMQELVEDPDAMLQIENWFRARGRAMSASNRLQALRPHAATIIENTAGTAPGMRATRGETEIFVMPGVPGEMREMFSRSVLPAVRELIGAGGGGDEAEITRVTKINTFGMGESVLGEKIQDLMERTGARAGGGGEGEGSKLLVGTTVHEGVVSVRIYATGTAARVEAMTQRVRAVVNERLRGVVFGEGEVPLEEVVAGMLLKAKVTVATAESCTGGLLAQLLTATPGSSGYFQTGWVTYANAAKHEELGVSEELIDAHGAVSEEVARAMAEGARKEAETTYALATTGIAGPEGGSEAKPVGLVWIALAGAEGTVARRFIFPGNRGAVRLRASQMALALLRWHLMGMAAPV